MSISALPTTGTRRHVRALATSQGFHFIGTGAATDGAEFLDLQAEHDRISDLYFKRADDELAIALDLRDTRLIHNHIRASMNLREEGYRFEQLEDDRREQALASLSEAREAGVAGSAACEAVLVQKKRSCGDQLSQADECEHGAAA